MYCSLAEAWPDFNSSSQSIPTLSQKFQSTNKIETFDIKPSSQLQDTRLSNCKYILEHIQNCDYCMKELYTKHMSSSPFKFNNPFHNLITADNKDVISAIFIGLLIILILQIFKS